MKSPQPGRARLRLPLACLCGLFLLSCDSPKNTFVAPPPTPVGVTRPVVREQQTYAEFPGRIEALSSVEVRARVRGILETINPEIVPGSQVEKGTLLAEIDDAPYVAARDAAKADLAKAKANMNIAEVTLKRRQSAGQAVSTIEVEAARAELEAAKATVLAAEASLANAEDTLGYCRITAPISGRISELQPDQFELVGNNEATLLYTIVDDQSMHVYFEANERAAIEFLRRRSEIERNKETPPKALLSLADGSQYPHEAQIEITNNVLDPDTGTLLIRAVVPNPEGMLADGLFVHVSVPKEIAGPSILVPKSAIQQDLAGFFLLCADENNAVVRKNVTLGDSVGELRIVTSGLEGTEKVITSGLQRVREGMSVSPTESEASAAPEPKEEREKAEPSAAS
ncbi:MAG: efflux RND transporter periplasmic adaptor subunit [Verrucomicrobiales bacterium]